MTSDAFFHETLHRGEQTLARLAELKVTVCGAGALGANVAESLARCGAKRLAVVDRDRIEERNLSTQPYRRADVGSYKAKILAGDLFRAVGARVDVHAETLNASNRDKLLDGAALVIDAFDNSVARRLLWEHGRDTGCPVLHAGMAEGYGEVVWNEVYRVPSDALDDVCDYALARTLAMLTSAVACEIVMRWVATGSRQSYGLTLGDLRITPYPPPAESTPSR